MEQATEQNISEDKAKELLAKYAPDERVLEIILKHSKAVQKVAVRIAGEISGVNMKIIRVGSLLHDIGRFKCPPGPESIKHGIRGAEILREEEKISKLPLEVYARIAERHLGAGISAEDIKEQSLPLPMQDFIPLTTEEKIITYADNLIAGSKEKDITYVINRYRKEIGKTAVRRIIKLHNEIEKLKGSDKFISE